MASVAESPTIEAGFRRRHAQPSRPRDAALVSLALCCLFFFHPAAMSVVGRAYYSIIGLNDVTAPAGFTVLLQPATVLSIVLLFGIRSTSQPPTGSRYGLGVALGVIFAGGTLSFLANYETAVVSMTYWSGLFAGLLVYIALSRLNLDEVEVNRLFTALALGALIPLAMGWFVFNSIWGLPDYSTVLAAQGDRGAFVRYEDATFGSRGNTVGLLVLISPALLYLALDATRPLILRIIWYVALIVIVLNLLILQERAAFLVALLSGAMVLRFRLGWRTGYALAAIILWGAISVVQIYAPETAEMVYGRFAPVLTGDADADASVDARFEAMREGLDIGQQRMPFGIGPGATVITHSQGSSHQLNIDQFMEGGLLGLLGSVLLCGALGLLFWRTVSLGNTSAINRRRFLMLSGPVMYVLNGVIANGPTASSYINIWLILCVALLALVPPLTMEERRGMPAKRLAPFGKRHLRA